MKERVCSDMLLHHQIFYVLQWRGLVLMRYSIIQCPARGPSRNRDKYVSEKTRSHEKTRKWLR